MASTSARQLLEAAGYDGRRFALLGPIENDTKVAARFTAPDTPLALDSLPPELRVEIALVAVHGGETLDAIVPVLARLRDVHADCVIVHDAAQLATPADMLALGFEMKRSPSIDGLVYVRDPAEAEQPREWNNSRNWANPANFSRYRW